MERGSADPRTKYISPELRSSLEENYQVRNALRGTEKELNEARDHIVLLNKKLRDAEEEIEVSDIENFGEVSKIGFRSLLQ